MEWPDTWYWSLTWVSWSLILATLMSGYTTITSSTTKHQTWIIVINFISVVTIGDCWHCYHKDSNGQTWPGIRHSLLIRGSSKIFVNHRVFVPSGVCLDNSALWELGWPGCLMIYETASRNYSAPAPSLGSHWDVSLVTAPHHICTQLWEPATLLLAESCCTGLWLVNDGPLTS